MSAIARCLRMAIGLAALTGVCQAYAQDFLPPPTCKTVVAPVSGYFEAKAKNQGVATPGFVYPASRGADGVVQGVDISKWQHDAYLQDIKQCGAKFAYIRISAGMLGFNETYYPSLWAQARESSLMVGAYHYLSPVPVSLKYVEDLSTVKGPATYNIQEFVEAGHQQALLFATRYEQLRKYDLERTPHAQFLSPMVSVIDDTLLPGKIAVKPEWYQATLCTFLADVEGRPWMKGRHVIIFTNPGLFERLQLATAPCLRGVKRTYWVQFPTPGAGDLPDTPPIEALCHPPDQTRSCVLHQYTNRGGLPMGSLTEGLDLSRFLGTEDEFKSLLSGS
jgi:hypothetical protein